MIDKLTDLAGTIVAVVIVLCLLAISLALTWRVIEWIL